MADERIDHRGRLVAGGAQPFGKPRRIAGADHVVAVAGQQQRRRRARPDTEDRLRLRPVSAAENDN